MTCITIGCSPWREHLGLTQAEVAARAGITQAAYAQMETAAKPRATTRKKIAAAPGITLEQERSKGGTV